MKLIIIIKNILIQGLAIDKNDNIFISSIDKFHIYDLRGNLLKLWDLLNNMFGVTKEIIVFRNEIYMIDTPFNRICVYCYDGKLTRYWGNCGIEPVNSLNLAELLLTEISYLSQILEIVEFKLLLVVANLLLNINIKTENII
jgi:hypothetical protein